MTLPGDDTILLAHGGGGLLMRQLIDEVILEALGRPDSGVLEDSAVMDWDMEHSGPPLCPSRGRLGSRLALTTDSYVVSPLFFRGGDIGRLAVAGTVNDLAVVGARPLWLTLSMVIEEGFSFAELRRVLVSARRTADEAGVRIVTGDTKVVERGSADRLFLNTAGVGAVRPGLSISVANAAPGDAVLLSGPIGDHGIAVLSEREGIAFDTPVMSDVAPLAGLVEAMLAASPSGIRCMRDPTRGGVAAALNEIAAASQVGILLREAHVPVRPAVQAACDMLGLDPLAVANEGKLIAVVRADEAESVLAAMHGHALGQGAALVGEVTARSRGTVTLDTLAGGLRIVDVPYGEQLPRIC